jgi:hypothetical protein
LYQGLWIHERHLNIETILSSISTTKNVCCSCISIFSSGNKFQNRNEVCLSYSRFSESVSLDIATLDLELPP